MKKSQMGLLVLIIILVAGSAVYYFTKNENHNSTANTNTQVSNINLPTPEKPALTFMDSDKPYIQITWDYSIADYFNIYRSKTGTGDWQKVNTDLYPSNAHASVDYNFPKDAITLYYRITSADAQGNQSQPSQVSSVSVLINNISNETTYSNAQYGFQFQSPKTYQLVDESASHVSDYFASSQDILPVIIKMSNPKVLYPNTDLSEVFFAVRITSDSKIDCIKPDPDTFQNAGIETIAGIDFTKSNRGGAAAGTQTNVTDYATYRNNTCYKLTTVIVTSGYGAVDGLQQVDEQPILSELHSILSTFKFTK